MEVEYLSQIALSGLPAELNRSLRWNASQGPSGVEVSLLAGFPLEGQRESIQSQVAAALAARHLPLASLSLTSRIASHAVQANLSPHPRVRNVTAVATGTDSYGVLVAVNGADTVFNLDLRNVIAVGDTDIGREATAGATVNVSATSSRFATIESSGPGTMTPAGSGSNITAAPVFADTTSYRATPASPSASSCRSPCRRP